ncbi:MAG: DUF512 domain-containing protein [Christensenellales bacterium]
MTKITGVDKKSPLYGCLRVGDEIIRINGRRFCDLLDYAYADSFDAGSVVVNREGVEMSFPYEKNQSETLGLTFDESAEITPKECKNNCIFCFVRQLPDNLRSTLYVKDDDYRLSFISGSYITCTNLNKEDIERIVDYKLSPLYVSVHATDEEIRKFMLGVKRAPEQMPVIKRFIDAGITVHTQIVLVGGINDGKVLEKSLKDLYDVGVATVAVVPVGLTGYRTGLYDIRPLTKEEAQHAIDITEEFYKVHEGFCYCADEMYQKAEREVPSPEYYGNYDQIENGVGLIAKFIDELSCSLKNARRPLRKRRIAVITGVSGESVMNKAKSMVEKRFSNVIVNVYPVINRFFGETVTVTGLVTATDIIRCYGDRVFDEDYVMLPSVMLKEFGDVFLDDVSVAELSKKLGKKIVVSHPDGEGFLQGILHGDKK